MSQKTIEALHRAATDGTLTTFRVPGGGDLTLSVDALMMRQALQAWVGIDDSRRADVFANVCRAIKSAIKKHKKGRLRNADAFASDCTLWFAYQLKFCDGERFIVQPPPASMFKAMAN